MNKKTQLLTGTLLAVLATSVVLFQNCSAPEVLSSQSSVDVGSSGGASFSIIPAESTILAGSTQSFIITGGTTPYTWSLSPAGCGGFNPSAKVYTAPPSTSICQLSIRDASNRIVRANIQVAESELSVTYSPDPVPASANVNINVTGGTPPYLITLLTGAGTMASTIYRAPATPETATFRITDSRQKTYDLSIPVAGGGAPGGGGSGTAGTMKIFRSTRGGDILTTVTQGEATVAGYIDNPAAAVTVFVAAGSTRIGLRRCFGPLHFVTASSCGGSGDEGSLGFIERSSVTGATKPVFVCGNSSTTFVTNKSAECSGLSVTAQGFGP